MRPLLSFATPLVLALALAAAPALAAGASLADATPEQVAAARDPYVEAKKAFDAGDYAAAHEGFAASYAIVASPNSHLMMAKALEKLERFADAYREAKAVLPEAEAAVAVDEKYARTADDARALVEDMRSRVGYLTVRLPYGETGAVTVAGRRLTAEELDEPILVDPGPVTVSFDGPRGVESRTMILGKGGTGLIDFGKREDAPPTPSPIEEDDGFRIGPARGVGIALGGIGVAGMVMFGVFGSFAKSTYGDLEKVCTADGRCPADRQADIDAGKRDQTIANVSLVVGVSGLIAGTSLFLLEPEIEDSATASVHLEVSPTYLGLGGRF